jgi:hypothetical protein
MRVPERIPRSRTGRIHQTFFACIPFLFCARAARADGPNEIYRVTRSSVSAAVLREAIGVLTISSGMNGDRTFHTYRKRGEFFVPYRRLDADKTVPVSSLDTRTNDPDNGIPSFRYPITKHEYGYVEIVVDPIADKRLWVNMPEIRKTFQIAADYFARLDRMQGSLIDPFFGNANAKRRVFMSPDLSAESTEISGDAYTVREERDGFLLLVPLGGMDDPPAQPVGWLPIRDADGLLTLWLIFVDNC